MKTVAQSLHLRRPRPVTSRVPKLKVPDRFGEPFWAPKKKSGRR